MNKHTAANSKSRRAGNLAKRPMQPIVKDGLDIVRFKANFIVRTLLDEATERGFGLNQLVASDFTQSDWEQFYQLIGYSLCGYHELNEVSDTSARAATRAARRVFPAAGGCRDDGCKTHCGVKRK